MATSTTQLRKGLTDRAELSALHAYSRVCDWMSLVS
jgi:hypothetical protein